MNIVFLGVNVQEHGESEEQTQLVAVYDEYKDKLKHLEDVELRAMDVQRQNAAMANEIKELQTRLAGMTERVAKWKSSKTIF